VRVGRVAASRGGARACLDRAETLPGIVLGDSPLDVSLPGGPRRWQRLVVLGNGKVF
jgi:hypothetical protein